MGPPLQLHPSHLSFSLQIHLTGWRSCLQDLTAAREWSVQESDEHIDYMEVTAVLMALTAFQERTFCQDVVLIANIATVVIYIK